MRTRTAVPLPVVVAVLLAALVVGSVGPAYAGISKTSVKKIAAKVLKKKAGSLSVSHAATATNATNLNGLPASAYLDATTVYSMTVTTPTKAVEVRLPLAPGSYQISYHAFLKDGNGGSGCYVYRRTGTTSATDLQYYADEDDSVANGGFSGSAVVTLPPGQNAGVLCSSSANFTTYAEAGAVDPIQVTVTPVDSVTQVAVPQTGVAAAARP